MREIASQFMINFINEQEFLLNRITQVLKKNEIDFCFIGDVVLPYYDYIIATENIGILISSKDEDKEKFWKLIGTFLKKESPTNWKKFKCILDDERFLNIIYSKDIAGECDSKGIQYRDPKDVLQLINNIPIINLNSLIEYKLSLGLYSRIKYKYLADIVALIRENKLPIDYADNFREDLKNRYRELWNEIE